MTTLSHVKGILHWVGLYFLAIFAIGVIFFTSNSTYTHFYIFKGHFRTLKIMGFLFRFLIFNDHLFNIVSLLLLVFFIVHFLSKVPAPAGFHSMLKRWPTDTLSIYLRQFVSIGSRVYLMIACIEFKMVKILLSKKLLRNLQRNIDWIGISFGFGRADSISTQYISFFGGWLKLYCTIHIIYLYNWLSLVSGNSTAFSDSRITLFQGLTN